MIRQGNTRLFRRERCASSLLADVCHERYSFARSAKNSPEEARSIILEIASRKFSTENLDRSRFHVRRKKFSRNGEKISNYDNIRTRRFRFSKTSPLTLIREIRLDNTRLSRTYEIDIARLGRSFYQILESLSIQRAILR